MALLGKYTVTGNVASFLPEGCDAGAVNPPDLATWAVDVPLAYAFVESVQGKDALTVVVSVYADSTKAAVIARAVFQFQVDMNGPNFVKQAYEYLKTLPPYSAMTDVLETGQTS